MQNVSPHLKILNHEITPALASERLVVSFYFFLFIFPSSSIQFEALSPQLATRQGHPGAGAVAQLEAAIRLALAAQALLICRLVPSRAANNGPSSSQLGG